MATFLSAIKADPASKKNRNYKILESEANALINFFENCELHGDIVMDDPMWNKLRTWQIDLQLARSLAGLESYMAAKFSTSCVKKNLLGKPHGVQNGQLRYLLSIASQYYKKYCIITSNHIQSFSNHPVLKRKHLEMCGNQILDLSHDEKTFVMFEVSPDHLDFPPKILKLKENPLVAKYIQVRKAFVDAINPKRKGGGVPIRTFVSCAKEMSKELREKLTTEAFPNYVGSMERRSEESDTSGSSFYRGSSESGSDTEEDAPTKSTSRKRPVGVAFRTPSPRRRVSSDSSDDDAPFSHFMPPKRRLLDLEYGESSSSIPIPTLIPTATSILPTTTSPAESPVASPVGSSPVASSRTSPVASSRTSPVASSRTSRVASSRTSRVASSRTSPVASSSAASSCTF